MIAKAGVFIVGAKRTAFGTMGGKLKNMTATDLCVLSSIAALKEANVSADKIDDVVVGSCLHSSVDSAYIGRHVGLRAGGPIEAPGLTINRLCGSGFESACLGAESILLGTNKLVLTGGADNMSRSPLTIDGLSARGGVGLGKGLVAQDYLWAALTDSYSGTPMGVTAENVGAKMGITRQQCDEYALRSQQLWEKAQKAGIFEREIVPITLKTNKGTEVFSVDEHPRPETTL